MEINVSQEPVPQEGQPERPQLPPSTGQGPAVDPTSMSPEQKRAMIYLGLAILVLLILVCLTIYILGFVATPATSDPHP